MGSVIGLLVLFLVTLALGGCAGPYGYGYGYGDGMSGSGYDGASGAAAMPASAAMDPGYAAAAQAGGYFSQTQPYYAPQPYVYNYNGATAYAPDPPPGVAGAPLPRPGDPRASPWIDQRGREQAARIRQGLRNGSLTPQEARRLWAEQRRLRNTEGQMRVDGYLSPQERARLTAMQNRASRDIYRARHNGMVQPGTSAPPPGHGPLSPMTQPGINGASMPAQVRPLVHGQRGQSLLPNLRFRRIATVPGQ
jgi:hypothetical protein